VIILGQNLLTFIIPIYSACDNRSLWAAGDRILGNSSKSHMKCSIFLHVLMIFLVMHTYLTSIYTTILVIQALNSMHCVKIFYKSKYCCCGIEKYIENKMCDLDWFPKIGSQAHKLLVIIVGFAGSLMLQDWNNRFTTDPSHRSYNHIHCCSTW